MARKTNLKTITNIRKTRKLAGECQLPFSIIVFRIMSINFGVTVGVIEGDQVGKKWNIYIFSHKKYIFVAIKNIRTLLFWWPALKNSESSLMNLNICESALIKTAIFTSFMCFIQPLLCSICHRLDAIAAYPCRLDDYYFYPFTITQRKNIIVNCFKFVPARRLPLLHREPAKYAISVVDQQQRTTWRIREACMQAFTILNEFTACPSFNYAHTWSNRKKRPNLFCAARCRHVIPHTHVFRCK